MNERIRELADRAGLQPFEDCGPGYVYKVENFAELIIQECINTVIQLQDDMDRQNWPTPYGCAEAISEHFGVEE
jgi:hypothetical protein